jgi:hypothetical protein
MLGIRSMTDSPSFSRQGLKLERQHGLRSKVAGKSIPDRLPID